MFGIIDWDKKNNGNSKVSVLGLNQRYSLENYIFDPIVLANFLLREKILNNKYFELLEEEKHFNFPDFEISKLQKITDKIVSDIYKEINPLSSEKTVVYYQGGISLKVPTWYLHHQGHLLEESIRRAYPELNRFKQLKDQIMEKVIDDLPQFISTDIFTLLRELHN